VKLHPGKQGFVSATVLDQHSKIHCWQADSTDTLWAWMDERDSDSLEGEAFYLTREEWDQAVKVLDTQGFVRIETEFDCDIVLARHAGQGGAK
jgi:hypothetical protein